ncbi:hypothetical protein BC827DRAFT_257862 [Russula dissimulans]|nr:hypothetical protein BC827DRAFT_257862 [Russula dissimulans]
MFILAACFSRATVSRNNCEPPLSVCTATIWPTCPRDCALVCGARGVRGICVSSPSSIHRHELSPSLVPVTRMWRECDRPCVRLHATHLRRSIALISVLAIPYAPLGSPSPTFYAALPNHTIVLLVLPFPRIQPNGTDFRPAPSFLLAFSTLFRILAATSAPLGQLRGYHHSIHSISTWAPYIPRHASRILLIFTYMNAHVGGQNRLSGAVGQFLDMLKERGRDLEICLPIPRASRLGPSKRNLLARFTDTDGGRKVTFAHSSKPPTEPRLCPCLGFSFENAIPHVRHAISKTYAKQGQAPLPPPPSPSTPDYLSRGGASVRAKDRRSALCQARNTAWPSCKYSIHPCGLSL